MRTNEMLKVKIQDKIVEYSVEYRKVKYIRYELRKGKLRLILPKRYNGNVEECIHNKDNWIYNKIVEYEKSQKLFAKKTADKVIMERTMPQLKELCSYFIEKYENQLEVKINRIQYRNMTTKWGSCSSLKNITLSKDLRYLPDDMVAYIVYHELAHIIVLAHNDKFYEIIKKEFPNYNEYDELLKEYWYLINNTK